MVDDRTKRIVGILLLIIGLLFLPFTFRTIMSLMLLPIPVILLPLGFASLYRGLSLKNRGILLISMGLIFISITMYLIIDNIRYIDSLIVLSIVNTTFWALLFIIPGILKIMQKTTLSEKFMFVDALAAFTTLWMLIYTLIINNMAPSNFLHLYFRYFWYVLGGALIFSLIIIVIAVFAESFP
ncbi:MAG: hypothetical protein HWN81_08870 [Candidatus Lokiarchaeota archaeon]|nr:hypothetical protein [Candidatus Lokiarchaeota archaeon]